MQTHKHWLLIAKEDLDSAKHLFSGSFVTGLFHAQQCAEKSLKAYLVFKNVDFPYTHDIFRLLELCAEHADWAETLENAKRLTLYAITTRYPGTEDKVTRDEALHAIELASQVREVVRNALSKEGMTIEEDTWQ